MRGTIPAPSVPVTRRVCGKALTGDISLSAGDVGAMPVYTDYTKFTSATNLGKILDAMPGSSALYIELNPTHAVYLDSSNHIPFAYGAIEIVKLRSRCCFSYYFSGGAKMRPSYGDVMYGCTISQDDEVTWYRYEGTKVT